MSGLSWKQAADKKLIVELVQNIVVELCGFGIIKACDIEQAMHTLESESCITDRVDSLIQDMSFATREEYVDAFFKEIGNAGKRL